MSQRKESVKKGDLRTNFEVFMFNFYLSSENQYHSEQNLLVCRMRKGVGEMYLMNQVC